MDGFDGPAADAFEGFFLFLYKVGSGMVNVMTRVERRVYFEVLP